MQELHIYSQEDCFDQRKEKTIGNRPGMIYAAILRLDQLMAPGESRFQAKQEARMADDARWTFTSGKIHSYRTRQTYQQQVLQFLNWVRDRAGLNRLEQVDAQAEELVTWYLQEQIDDGKSAYTLQTMRSALRLFFGDQRLAEALELPKRQREQIRRSRLVTKQDQHFQPENWSTVIAFLRACGLRREEACALFVREVYRRHDGQLVVLVRNGKGGQSREVYVLPINETAILTCIQDRQPDEHVFQHLPKNMDIHSYRRVYAQELYLALAPGYTLPPVEGRLSPAVYDRRAALFVSEQLVH